MMTQEWLEVGKAKHSQTKECSVIQALNNVFELLHPTLDFGPTAENGENLREEIKANLRK